MAPQPTAVATTNAGAQPATPTQAESAEAASIHNEQTRQDLERKLQELIECLLELSITVYDFQAESNSLVHQKIQELIAQLSDIEGFKDKLDMMVPWEVLSYIEDGKNPDLFSKSFVEAVAGENQFTNGKITALKSFEAALTQNLGSAFPEEMMDYEKILKEVNTTANTDPGTISANASATPLEGESSSGTINHTVSSSSSSLGPSSISPAS
ncbi:transcription factor subunit Med10 of mediator complex-domain-containing protein [Gamsiella multidivaricata]|uniref:transcription factor subunit Med10 of mediator complex-domain-containing protein n=1 Tax=Gamsiella multidivaricata TaxID=101098 RepID=UPI002220E761|nr:transcription factor subunit Med10 of mediator complex-domain-containing protein [Gamsiella multidivaricata]KAI7823867.1 transcription factor subunit Med10 of mediator complex-domain-containing protein [Gamsiella multidivaricata]